MSLLGKSTSSASGGLGKVAKNMRDVRTVATTTLGLPAIIAGLGAVAPLATATAGATAQLATGLGQAAAGFALIGGTATGGAIAGLTAYQKIVSQVVSDSRAAYEATHENAMAQLEQQRNTILNTQANIKFNEQLNKTVIALTKVEAGIGNRVLPAMTRLLETWTGKIPQLKAPIFDLIEGVTRIGESFGIAASKGERFQSLMRILNFVADSGISAAQAISNLGNAGLVIAPMLIAPARRLQATIVGLTGDINKWVSSTEGANRLGEIFTLLERRMYGVLRIGRDLSGALIDIFRALDAGGQTDAMMRGLINLTAQFRELVRFGGEGSQRITAFMKASQPALQALGRLAGTAAREFLILADNLVRAGQQGGKIGTLATVVNSLTKTLEPLRKLLQSTFISLGPRLAELIPELARFAEFFLGTTGPLNAFVSGLTRVLKIFNSLPPGVKSAIANFVAFNSILRVMGGPSITSAVTGLSSLGVNIAQTAAIAGAGAGKMGALGGVFSRLGGVIMGLGRFLLGPWGLAIAGLVAAGIAIYKNWSKIAPIFQPVINAFRQIASAVKPLLNVLGRALMSALRSVAKGFLQGIAPGKSFSGMVKSLAPPILKLAKQALPVMARGVLQVQQFLKRAQPTLTTIGRIVGHVLVGAFRGFMVAVRAGVTVIKVVIIAIKGLVGAAKSMVAAFKAAANGVRAAWTAMQKAANSAAQAIGRTVESLKTRLSSWVRSLIGSLVNFWKNQIWQPMATFVTQKSTGIMQTLANLKTKATSWVHGLVGPVVNFWKNSIWQPMADWAIAKKNGIVQTLMNLKSEIVRIWGEIESFVNGVLSRLGFGGGGGGTEGAGSGEARRRSQNKPPVGAPVGTYARGGIDWAAEGGGFRRARQPQHIVWGEGPADEAAIFVTKDKRHRRDNEKYASVAANLLGGTFIPEKQSRAMGFALGGTLGVDALSPEQRAAAAAVEKKFPQTTQNTYVGHPGGQENSFDTWGSGGRGDPIGSTGNAVKSFLQKAYSDFNWLIWNGIYTTPSGSQPYWDPNDMHYNHVHFTRGASGFGSGAVQITNPAQTLFDNLLWPPVQRFADTAVAGIKAISPFKLVQAAGGLTAKTVDRIHDAIDARIPDTKTAPGAHGPQTGKSGKGLTGSSVVSQGGWPSNLQKTAVGVMWEESSFNAHAQNPSGARGLFQIMPSTASGMGADYSKLYDPVYNSQTGKKVYDAQGWGAWVAYPPSSDSMNRGGQPITGYHTGGMVKGRGDVPAVLQAGEVVIPRDVVRSFAYGGVANPKGTQPHGAGPAVDVYATPGTTVSAPFSGNIQRVGSDMIATEVQGFAQTSQGQLGFVAAHMTGTRGQGPFKAGDILGKIANWAQNPASSHVHWAFANGHYPPPANVSALSVLGGAPSQKGGSTPAPSGSNQVGSGGTSSSGGSGGGSAFTGGGARGSGSSSGGSASTSGNSIPTDLKRSANAGERMDKKMTQMVKLLSGLGQEIREGMNFNLAHGRKTGNAAMRGHLRGLDRREMGGPMISRAR